MEKNILEDKLKSKNIEQHNKNKESLSKRMFSGGTLEASFIIASSSIGGSASVCLLFNTAAIGTGMTIVAALTAIISVYLIQGSVRNIISNLKSKNTAKNHNNSDLNCQLPNTSSPNP